MSAMKDVLMRPMVVASIVIGVLSYLNTKVYNNLSIVKKEKMRNRMTFFLNLALIVFCAVVLYYNWNSKKEVSFVSVIESMMKK